ncbi:hypothetical protein DDF62_18395 [Caulobacter radicis]|uniref:hypothetical protein n=1 Tax=Caulobacter radicis TaxID=2172650 RepID=UPI000D56DA22|nr:hypothetical protein [Caulobacter radicis]PVM86139.1 hypothetical protein DDF62_18395 [Caulobacter radicis]
MAANLLLIGLLSLVERTSPPAEIPPMLFEIDRLEDEPPPAEKRAPAKASSSALSREASSSQVMTAPGPVGVSGDGEAAPAVGPSAQVIDPAWKVDPKAVDRWKLTEGNPDFRWGRYHRACKGLSSEHLTDEEKDKCWGGFADKIPKENAEPGPRKPPKFVPRGLPPPPPPYAEEARKQSRCRAYRDGRASQPRLRDGLC